MGIYWGSLTVGRLVFGLLSERWSPELLLRLSISGLLASTVLVWQGGAGIVGYVGLAATGFLLSRSSRC